MIPSCPGCRLYLSTFEISSNVMPSFETGGPPCTTRYLFFPAGERIAGCVPGDLVDDGGRVGDRSVASGTVD